MLLVLDVSNASTKFGLYEGDKLLGNWRIDTNWRQTEDEYGLLLTGLMRQRGLEPGQVSGAIMANVVPQLIATFVQMIGTYFGQRCIVVNHELDIGLGFRTVNPAETGADRIV